MKIFLKNGRNKNKLRTISRTILRTASLGFNFTGSYNKESNHCLSNLGSATDQETCFFKKLLVKFTISLGCSRYRTLKSFSILK